MEPRCTFGTELRIYLLLKLKSVALLMKVCCRNRTNFGKVTLFFQLLVPLTDYCISCRFCYLKLRCNFLCTHISLRHSLTHLYLIVVTNYLLCSCNFPPISIFEICQYISRYIFVIYFNTFAGINSLLVNQLPYLSIHLPYQFSLDPCPYIPSFCFIDKGTR